MIRDCETHVQVKFILYINIPLFYYTQKESLIKERNVDKYRNWVSFFFGKVIGLVEQYKLVENSRNKPTQTKL